MFQVISATGGKRAPATTCCNGHRLRNLRIVGGFLDGASLNLADGLNCIIGARGSGKTTVLELIRFTLDAFPASPTDVAARKKTEALIAENLGGGRVELTVATKDGLAFTVTRSVGEDPIVLDADGQPTAITLRGGTFFGADIFSQNEIERIADHGPAQLALIDRVESERITAVTGEIRSVQNSLDANAGRIAPLQSEIASLTEELSALPALEERLRGLASVIAGDGDAINQGHALKALRDRESRAIVATSDFLTDFERQIGRFVGHVASRTAAIFANGVGDGPNAETITEVRRIAAQCGERVDVALGDAQRAISLAVAELLKVRHTLRVRHDEQEVAFRTLLDEHEAAQTQATERSRLERQRNQLLAHQNTRDGLQDQLNGLHESRQQLLGQLTRLRDQRFAIRRDVTQSITAQLAGRIRVSVKQAADTHEYAELLTSALRNARVKTGSVVPKLVQAFWPDRLAALVRAGEPAPFIDEGELSADQARKVLDALADAETLFRLESVDLGDVPCIELNDNGEYKPSPALSTGQKCTAVLPILLLDSANPLLIDQPEDNLDNRFIFEHVVGSLREVKSRRQLVFVTHNPNVPVLGDAERVFVLDSDGSHGFVVQSGNVDDCRDEILTLLEGGAEAFEQRQLRYRCIHGNVA